MTEAYEHWMTKVRNALKSINMDIETWQQVWQFNFEEEFAAGIDADFAAQKANRYWWYKQNASLQQNCRKTPRCWLPRNHAGDCQPWH